MMKTKEQLKDIIQDRVTEDQFYGNDIADQADSWRDAITKKLNKMSWKDLKKLAYKEVSQ